jgi:serine protease AprX
MKSNFQPRQRSRRLRSRWGVPGVLVLLAMAGSAGTLAPSTTQSVAAPPAAVRVIVTATDVAAAQRAVRAAGGTVTAELPLLGAVVAEVPRATDVKQPGVQVVPDRSVRFTSSSTAQDVPGSTVRATLGLPTDGHEGAGVTVALVDTGVAEVADLTGRVTHVDLSGDGSGDGYGHGTFLAGLIAGTGEESAGAYQGAAPGANILDVKVADADGSTQLSTVLAGLQQVADRQVEDHVAVLNLSLASSSPLPYQVDPLNQALRALWHRGITVVVASGNDGPAQGSVATPGNDPTLLTVGGADEQGTAGHGDDTVAAWSGRGPTDQGVSKPDLVAPGAHVVGLRAPGSIIDLEHPSARVGNGYFLGSGTSMSAAVASGAIAGLLAKRDLAPDQVKQLLMATAYRATGLDPRAAGQGGLDVAAAAAFLQSPAAHKLKRATPSKAPGTAARWQALGAAISSGDHGAAVKAWDELGPEARSWAARSWASLDPQARSWAARSWAARSWAGSDATADGWAARSWAARSWAGEDWAARSWADVDGTARSWAARSWAGDDWAARSWAARSWAARSWAATWR